MNPAAERAIALDGVAPVQWSPVQVIAYVDRLESNLLLVVEGDRLRALVRAISLVELGAALDARPAQLVNGLPVSAAVLVLLRKRLSDECAARPTSW